MIITCEKCSKNFSINDNLIPETGRLLQCGSCDHKWFYNKPIKKLKIENEVNEINIDKKTCIAYKTKQSGRSAAW